MTRVCIFNGGTPVTREHVIPRWIHQFLPGFGATLTYEREGRIWEDNELTLTVKHVCKSCNDGWMNRLESRVRPLISGPIGYPNPCAWKPREQRTVATWAYKTALMCGLTGHSHVPEADFRHLFKNLHPPGRIRVWATLHGPREGATKFKVVVIENNGLLFEGTQGTRFRGYAITVGVGHLAFQVFGYEPGHHMSINPPPIAGVAPGDYEVQIWPVQPRPVTWPPRLGFDRESLIAYSKRFET